MPQLMVHKKLEGIPKFQSQEAGNGDGDFDFVEAYVSGLAQEIDEPDLILDEFVDDAAVEVGVEGILVLERFHFVECLFGQHGLGKIVTQNARPEFAFSFCCHFRCQFVASIKRDNLNR